MRALKYLIGATMLVPGAANSQFNKTEPVPPASADVILENARIYTPNGWVTSMAVAGGAIVALGDAAAMEPHKTLATRVIKLDGQLVLPGLHDMHVHPMGAGLSQTSCSIPHGSSPAQILAIIKGCADKAEPGEWITGGGYQNDSFGITPPTKEMLDSVAPKNPVILRDISGHSGWANSLALQIAGIGKDTPDPHNGIIERDSAGEATGVLRENAAMLVSRQVTEASVEKAAAALAWSMHEMMSYGITAYDDAGVAETAARAYAKLADEGKLKQRVRGCLWARDPDLLQKHMLYARPNFSPSCIKIALDGVPTDGHTAAMVDPYEPLHGHHGDNRERGMLMIRQAELDKTMIDLDRRGFTVKFHAAGDAAVRAGLNAIEAARKANGPSGQYHNVGHNSFVKIEDIRRARAIGAAFEFSPYIWYTSPIIGDIRKAVGEERMKRWIPVKDALDAGALVVPGSDWNVVPSVNPWIAIETLITRQVPGGGGEVLGAQQRITLPQALDIFTRQSARQMNFDFATGTIEKGKLADIIVLDQNIFEVPVTSIHKTKVLMTFIGGELVYDAKGALR
ncbi:MAG: amidohydrolase family protein [Alphaproteobacteria bacterium]|nr:amidohydrolase family protein [Alphaproteobacteria bacterium]MBU0875878.1 amidohydrolase family protein [Alphaproteobacteria bacterium]MBU1769941.1 amidohydrolase family protein [Alphaproteobacteria bacterium]